MATEERPLEATVHSGNSTPTGDDHPSSLLHKPTSTNSLQCLVPPRLEHPNHDEEAQRNRPPNEAADHHSENTPGRPPRSNFSEAPSPSFSFDHSHHRNYHGGAAPRFPDYETTASQQFFSEPSLSPDEESRVRAPHLLPLTGGRVFRHLSSSEEEHHHPGRRFGQASPVPSSPGNTSLSSWDSPSRANKRIWLHFASSSFRSGGAGTPMSNTGGGSSLPPHPHHLVYGEPSNGHGATLRFQQPSPQNSVLTPPKIPRQLAPEAEAADPLFGETKETVEYRGESGTPKQKAGSGGSGHFKQLINSLKDADSLSESLVVIDSSENHHVSGLNDSDLQFDQSLLMSNSSLGLSPHLSKSKHNAQNYGAEESIIMDLSDSDDEPMTNISTTRFSHDNNDGDRGGDDENRHCTNSRTSTFDSDYLQEQNADDEKTEKTDIVEQHAGFATGSHKKQPHVRVRSGDAAAATLATGGTDWVGMKMDNIPLPDDDDEDNDDEEESVKGNNAYKHTGNVQQQSQPAQRKEVAQPVKHHPQQPPNRPGMVRPPLPAQKVPLHVIPPPPGMAPSPPNPSHYPQQYPNSNAVYNNNNNMHYPPSPSHYSPRNQPPQINSHNGWTSSQNLWLPHQQQDGFVVQNHMMQPDLPAAYPPWPPEYHQPHQGGSAQLRNRLNSSGPMNEDPSFAPREDRRDSWGNARHLSLRSIHVAREYDQRLSLRSVYSDIDHHSLRSLHSNHSSQFSQHSGRDSESGTGGDGSGDDDDDDALDSDRPMAVKDNQLFPGGIYSFDQMDEIEHQLEDRNFRGTYQNVLRSRSRKDLMGSPFANIGKKSEGPVNWATFNPRFTTFAENDDQIYPTFICPKCKTRQREFFSVSDAPKQLEGPAGYLAAYFVLYVTASLFIFGLEEGWEPLDCVYFAVISLTTAGLGDFVPTTDSNKIICSIFIYFGVACIGLLLGSYIAGMLDDKAYTDAKAKQIDACPNCARIQAAKDLQARRYNEEHLNTPNMGVGFMGEPEPPMSKPRFHSERVTGADDENHKCVYLPRPKHHHHKSHHQTNQHHHQQNHPLNESPNWAGQSTGEMPEADTPPPPPPPIPPVGHNYCSPKPQFSVPPDQFPSSPTVNLFGDSPNHHDRILGSPMTRQILGRQSHTRHASFDIGGQKIFGSDSGGSSSSQQRRNRQTYQQRKSNMVARAPSVIREDFPETQTPLPYKVRTSVRSRSECSLPKTQPEGLPKTQSDRNITIPPWPDVESDEGSSEESDSSLSTIDHIIDERMYKIKAAKYVFVTLQEALGNSLVILAVGCVGFYLIENFTLVDSWYFTTVLLTTTGYGDIVPVTKGGKLFATIYLLVGGTILLNNMSMISMIPLELRKRRIERAVLTQFGDSLDDDALRELATGPLIKRLSLTVDRSDGLAECTREMFALAMLVRLGKVSEGDIRQTFAAFRRLDLNNEGVLNSKSIIAGMIQRRRSIINPMGINHRALRSDRSTRGLFFNGMASVPFPTGHNESYFGEPPTPSETSSLLQQAVPANYQAGSHMHSSNSPTGAHYPFPSSPSRQQQSSPYQNHY